MYVEGCCCDAQLAEEIHVFVLAEVHFGGSLATAGERTG